MKILIHQFNCIHYKSSSLIGYVKTKKRDSSYHYPAIIRKYPANAYRSCGSSFRAISATIMVIRMSGKVFPSTKSTVMR